MNEFKPRFVRAENMAELYNLYHLARTALAGQVISNHDRMIWATKEFAKLHSYVTATGAYKDLSDSIHY
jgi:hypothetical protein